MTPFLVTLLCQEFRELLPSGRIAHIAQSAPEIVELTVYHPNRANHYLVIALLPSKPLIFAAAHKQPALSKPPNFCRSLRKHLEYAQIVDIQNHPGERLLQLVLKTAEGLYRLVFEGIPKYPNLILVGPDDQIISALRYKNDVERPVLPHAHYAPPPQPQEKPNFWGLDETQLNKLWESNNKPPLTVWIKNEFRGTDPELAAHLESFGESAFSQWSRIKKEVLEIGWSTFTLFPGPPPSLKLFPETSPTQREHQLFKKPSQALERLFNLEFQHRHLMFEKARLESEIAKGIKHEKRILEKLKKDRAEAEKSDQYQWWGELLMAQLHKVKLHLSQADVEDVVRGGPSPVAIPLDPEATPLLNAQRFFKKAKKGSRGLAQVEKREMEIKDRLEHLKSAQRSLPALQDVPEIRKAFQDLFPKKKEPVKPKKEKAEKVPTPNIHREKVSGQFEICAGTSAAANEYVTFQLAQPDDLWFHARDLPGSHVILRRLQRGAVVTEEMILHAARLAAAHSKAKPGTKVTVSYTEKKNIKRIPGAPVGMVSLTKEKSLMVEI